MEEISIDVWYGSRQEFGQLGRAQRWINVLGNISGLTDGRAFYSINGRANEELSLGSDQHRLAKSGDFNVQLAWSELDSGDNDLQIMAVTANKDTIEKSVALFLHDQRKWKIPYSIDFSQVSNLQDVVQIVDGKWELTPAGVHTKEPYYDRVLTIGDSSWTNYEALIKLTIHGWTPSVPGPPTYNVSHFGVAMRWRGHHVDGKQPSRRWYPLGAQGEFLLRNQGDSCRWRILFDGGRQKDKPKEFAVGINPMQSGIPIWIKTQILTLPDGDSRYRFKQWSEDVTEPTTWDVEGTEADDYPSGALCLVPHNSDVTIHEIMVRPIN